MLDEAPSCSVLYSDNYNSAVAVTTRRKGLMENDSNEGSVARRINFDICNLLQEQHNFLDCAQPFEIRASLFLRLRLSAKQKRKIQCNQLAERPDMQSKRMSSSSVVAAQISLVSLSPEGVISNVVEGVESECGRNCSGCQRRYTDMTSLTHHQRHCRKYALLLRRTPTASLETVLGSDIHIGRQGGNSTTSVSPPAEAITARGLSRTVAPSEAPHVEMSTCRAGTGSSGGVPVILSLRAESQSTNYSFSMPISSPQEERREEYSEKNDKKEHPYGVSVSRECSPMSSGISWKQKTTTSLKNYMDEIPASVEARLSCEKESSFATWKPTTFFTTTREHSEGAGSKNPAMMSGGQSIVTLGSNSVSTNNLMAETEGANEPIKPCPHCGRRFFAESRWPRHVAVCEQQKQQAKHGKTYGSRPVIDTPPAKRALRQSTGKISKSSDMPHDTPERLSSSTENSAKRGGTDSDKKDLKWQSQSSQVRNSSLRNSSLRNSGRLQSVSVGGNGQGNAYVDCRVSCPNCGRRFASSTIEQHLSLCKKRNGSTR